jgi:hypothetical protein
METEIVSPSNDAITRQVDGHTMAFKNGNRSFKVELVVRQSFTDFLT